MDALLVLTVGIATIGAVNTQVLTTTERRREIGLLRAVGATGAQVRAAIRWETLLVAGVASLVALAVGVPLALAVVEAQRPLLPPVVPVRRLATVAAATLVATYAAAAVPAWWTTRGAPRRPDDR